MKKFRIGMALCGSLTLALSLSGCDEALKLRADETAMKTKVDALYTETQQLETQLAQLRKSFPPASNVTTAAQQMYNRAAGELTIYRENLKSAQAGLTATQAEVKALKEQAASRESNAQ